MPAPANIARSLSTAFLAGELDVEQLVDRGSRVLGRRWRWLRPLAGRVVETFGGRAHPRMKTLARYIHSDAGFRRACGKHTLQQREVVSSRPAAMLPVRAATSWRLPAICSVAALADWLGITVAELGWFADRRLLESKGSSAQLRHYRYRPLMKRRGAVRLIESPKPRLKHLQRHVLSGLLDHIPPHKAAHGFRRGRSIASFAAPHVGQQIVLRIDLQDFFPSIPLARVQTLFRTIGYPECVADLLAGLCTNATPMDVWGRETSSSGDRQLHAVRWLYARPHLPQGAPTSPALANLCAFRLDCRLEGLARSAGAVYTRYADDLAFSGQRDFARAAKRFHLHACATALDERFLVHHRKTRLMRSSVRQRLAGLVVNERLNVSRQEFDRLKATLTNCIRLGAQSQNRSECLDYRRHLEGRLSFIEMVNPERGRRLRRLFDQIVW